MLAARAGMYRTVPFRPWAPCGTPPGRRTCGDCAGTAGRPRPGGVRCLSPHPGRRLRQRSTRPESRGPGATAARPRLLRHAVRRHSLDLETEGRRRSGEHAGLGDRTVARLADRESGLPARTIARRLSPVPGLYAYLVARGGMPVAAGPVPRGLLTRGRAGRGGRGPRRWCGCRAPCRGSWRRARRAGWSPRCARTGTGRWCWRCGLPGMPQALGQGSRPLPAPAGRPSARRPAGAGDRACPPVQVRQSPVRAVHLL
jgi:hypothetical protein